MASQITNTSDLRKMLIETIEGVRPVFLAMIKAGVSREHANKTMTYLLELHDP